MLYPSLSLSIAPGYDSYEIIMKQQSARVRPGAKLSLSLWTAHYLGPIHPSAPCLLHIHSFIQLLLSWMTEWKDVLAVHDISLSSRLCSLFLSLLLSAHLLSPLISHCRSTLPFCNPLITLRGCFSFSLALLLLPSFCCVCDVYLFMHASHTAVCVCVFQQWLCSKLFFFKYANLSLSFSLPLSLSFSPSLNSQVTVHWLHSLFMSSQWIISMHSSECWDSSGCFTFPVLCTLFSHTFYPSLSLFPHLPSLLWHFVPPYW